MPEKIDDLLPTAKDIQKQAALKEAEKAEQYARLAAAAEAEKRPLIERLSQALGQLRGRKGPARLDGHPACGAKRTDGSPGVPVPELALHRQGPRHQSAWKPGWEKTLTGIPKEIFQLWADYLKPRGYRIRYQIIDFPGGIPGDIGITIAWGD